MVGAIPLKTEEQRLVPLAIILLIEYILTATILFALQKNNTIHKGFNAGKNFSNIMNNYGRYWGGVGLFIVRFLFLVSFCCVIGYHYRYQNKHGEWLQYSQWSLFLSTFYYLIVSILSLRKLQLFVGENLSTNDSESHLIDPMLTKFASNLFSLTGPVALMSSVLSVYDNRASIVFVDHIVLVGMLLEIVQNTFCVTASDAFFCFNYAFLYMSVLFVSVVLLDSVSWPHSMLRLDSMWCVLRYNLFLLGHVLSFSFFYLLTTKIAISSVRAEVKITPVLLTSTLPLTTAEEGNEGEGEDVSDGAQIAIVEELNDEENPPREKEIRHVKSIDDTLEEQYCPNNKDTYDNHPTSGALSAEEENDMKNSVGRLSYQLTKQTEKNNKLKVQCSEKDIKLKQLAADLTAKQSRLDMLIAQQREMMDERIETPVHTFELPTRPKHTAVTASAPATAGTGAAGDHVEEFRGSCGGGVVNCPGCEKEYTISDDMKLVEIDHSPEPPLIDTAAATKVLTPFITADIDKQYFKHVLLAEDTKESRKRAKKLGLSVYYASKDEGMEKKEKCFKLKKDLQNEIYLVCTGDLLYASRHPETVEKKHYDDREKAEVIKDDHDSHDDVVSHEVNDDDDDSAGENKNNQDNNYRSGVKKVVFYRQKLALKEALQSESIDSIRDRAEALDIDWYDDEGGLKLKKRLKEEIYLIMTGEDMYVDVRQRDMRRVDSRVL